MQTIQRWKSITFCVEFSLESAINADFIEKMPKWRINDHNSGNKFRRTCVERGVFEVCPCHLRSFHSPDHDHIVLDALFGVNGIVCDWLHEILCLNRIRRRIHDIENSSKGKKLWQSQYNFRRHKPTAFYIYHFISYFRRLIWRKRCLLQSQWYMLTRLRFLLVKLGIYNNMCFYALSES